MNNRHLPWTRNSRLILSRFTNFPILLYKFLHFTISRICGHLKVHGLSFTNVHLSFTYLGIYPIKPSVDKHLYSDIFNLVGFIHFYWWPWTAHWLRRSVPMFFRSTTRSKFFYLLAIYISLLLSWIINFFEIEKRFASLTGVFATWTRVQLYHKNAEQ